MRFASTSGHIPRVVDAWADSVNSTGGLNGRKVRIIAKDVGTTTGAGLTAAQELINKEHVAAILDFDPATHLDPPRRRQVRTRHRRICQPRQPVEP
ncbi:ABC transporter substrate-binding protein [Nocardia vinacea]|uniref:ABC transporter substrate-binding protein n=1 Tax=Nocardia vinacea TaxID=96468 RepID=UPI000317F958